MLEFNPELKKSMDSLMELGVDCYTYLKFVSLLTLLDKRAKEGDEPSEEIIQRVIGVGRLVDYSKVLK